MAQPGWYPDPSGSGRPRYWDGESWAPAVAEQRPTGRRGAWALLAGLLAVVLVIAAIIWQPWRSGPWAGTPEDTNSARPTGSQWDERQPSESPPPSEDPDDGGQIVDCPQNSTEMRSEVEGGRVHGGGLSFEPPRDWRPEAVYMPWLYDHNSLTKRIKNDWMSNVSVGAVRKDEGFRAPRSTAESLMNCLASSDLYRGFTGRDDVRNEAFSLDGRPGWRLTANVLVDRDDGIAGDVVDVVVLDLGREDTLSVWISCATIDDRGNLEEVQRAVESLRVD